MFSELYSFKNKNSFQKIKMQTKHTLNFFSFEFKKLNSFPSYLDLLRSIRVKKGFFKDKTFMHAVSMCWYYFPIRFKVLLQ